MKRLSRTVKFCVTVCILAGLAGCETFEASYPVSVSASFDEQGLNADKSYLLVFINGESKRHVSANDNALYSLKNSLEEKGYSAAPRPSDANILIVIDCGVGPGQLSYKKRSLSPEELNPDSVKYKNLADMVGGGRYTALLNDDPYVDTSDLPTRDANGVVIPPLILNDLLKRRQMRPKFEYKQEVHYTKYLSLSAWDIEEFNRMEEAVQIWRVTVFNNDENSSFENYLGPMIGVTAKYIETTTDGLKEEKAKKSGLSPKSG